MSLAGGGGLVFSGLLANWVFTTKTPMKALPVDVFRDICTR